MIMGDKYRQDCGLAEDAARYRQLIIFYISLKIRYLTLEYFLKIRYKHSFFAFIFFGNCIILI